MLSSLWGSPAALPQSEPGVIGFWSQAALRAALQSGDVVALSSSLPTRDVPLPCFGGICSPDYSGVLSFGFTLLLLHSDKPDACLLALRLVDRVAPNASPGSLSAGIQPTLVAVPALEGRRKQLLEAEQRKWIGANAAKADDSVADAALPILLVVADFLCSATLSTKLPSTTSSPFVLPTCRIGIAFATSVLLSGAVDVSSIVRSLHGLLASAVECIGRISSNPEWTADTSATTTLLEDVSAFACAVLQLVAFTHRRIRAGDISAVLSLIRACFLFDATGVTIPALIPCRAAAAVALEELWKNQAIHATTDEAAMLAEAFACALRVTDANGMTAIMVALRMLFASTSIPPADVLADAVCDWFADSGCNSAASDARVFCAATDTSLRWMELSSNRTLPQSHAQMLRKVTGHSNRVLLLCGLASWPLGCGIDTDKTYSSVICAINKLAVAICSQLEDTSSTTCAWCADASDPHISIVVRAVSAHASNVVLFYAAACVKILMAHAIHQRQCLHMAGHEAWRHITAYCSHLVRGVILCRSRDHVAALATAVSALGDVLSTTEDADAKVLRCASVVGTAVEIMAVVASLEGRMQDYSAVEEACVAVLTAAQEDHTKTVVVEVLASLTLPQLRIVQACYHRHRGWLVDGALVATLSRLFGDARALALLKARRDVVAKVAFTPQSKKSVSHALLSLQSHLNARNDSLPYAVARRIIDFSGDAVAVQSALATGHAFLLCSLL